MNYLSWALIISLIGGQLIKFPSFNSSGATLLDLSLLLISFFGILKMKKFKAVPKSILSAFIFTAVCALSLILTPLHLSFTEYLISASYIIRFVIFIFVCLLIYCDIIKLNLEKIIIYSSTIISVLGLLQLIFLPNLDFLSTYGWDPHYFRTASTFLDPNFLGAFLSIGLIFILNKYYPHLKSRKLIIFIMIYLAIMTTFSRSSYLMFLTSGLTLAFIKKSFKLAVVVILLFAEFIISFQVYTLLVSRPRNIDRGYSANARLNTWQQGIGLFTKEPVLGVGFNTYRYALREYSFTSGDFTNTRGASSNDSSLLYVLATTGSLGIVIYLFFLYSLMELGIKSFKNKINEGLVLTASIAGLLVHSFFNNSLFYPPILFFIILLTGSLNLTKDNNSSEAA